VVAVHRLLDGADVIQQCAVKLASVLDMDVPPEVKPRLITLTETTEMIPDYPFSTLPFGFERTKSGAYVEVLYPRDLFVLMGYHLLECLKRKVRMRACRNCGKYFAVMKNSKAEYCNHPFDAKGRSCKEVVSIL